MKKASVSIESLASEAGAVGSVGLTKDSGYQAGARRTFEIGAAKAWSLLVSARCNELLTGRKAALEGEGPLSSWEGPPVAYQMTTYAPGSHLRMKWRESGWTSDSTFQARVIPAPRGKTTIAFHQERLVDSGARAAMLERWDRIFGGIAEMIDAKRKGETE